MAGYSTTQQLFMESEVVKKGLQEWLLSFPTMSNLIPKRNVEMVSERDFRIPALTDQAGREGTYDPNFGEIGRGQNQRGQVMISTFYPLRMAFELSQLSMDATATLTQANESVFKRTMKNAMPEFSNFHNRTFFTDGTPVLGVAIAQATVSGFTQYTMNNLFGVNRVRRGQYVAIYDTTLTTLKAISRINTVNWANRICTMDQTVPGAAATDVFCWEGVSGANPTGVNGLYYWVSAAQTGTTATINRALEPEVWSNTVSGAGGLNYILGLNLFHAMLTRRGEDAIDGLMGIAGTAQHAAAIGNVMSLQRIDLSMEQTAPKDLLPKSTGATGLEFPFAGIKHRVFAIQEADRIDWISPQETWGLARLHDLKFFEQGGQRFFPIYGSGGSPSAGTWFALLANQNFYCANPGNQGYISSLPIASPYA